MSKDSTLSSTMTLETTMRASYSASLLVALNPICIAYSICSPEGEDELLAQVGNYEERERSQIFFQLLECQFGFVRAFKGIVFP